MIDINKLSNIYHVCKMAAEFVSAAVFVYFINLFSFFVNNAARMIFAVSGMMKGKTHQPKIVFRLAGVLFFAYTKANHAVPKI